MLERANTLADLGISYPFRAWMLLSLVRLSPKKWSEYLKDMGHKFPRTVEDYQKMKDSIVREKTLESSVGAMGTGGHSAGQTITGTYHTGSQDDGESQCILLYLCLGCPSQPESSPQYPSNSYLQLQDQPSSKTQTTVYLMDLDGIQDTDSENDTDDETWEKENLEDPYSPEGLEQEEREGRTNPIYLANLWWAQRTATRRFRAA